MWGYQLHAIKVQPSVALDFKEVTISCASLCVQYNKKKLRTVFIPRHQALLLCKSRVYQPGDQALCLVWEVGEICFALFLLAFAFSWSYVKESKGT